MNPIPEHPGNRKLPRHAYQGPEATRIHDKYTRKGLYNLLPFEIRWRDRYEDLERKGYRLRPRYRREWKPSWIGTNIDPDFCEDSVYLLVSRSAFRWSFPLTPMIFRRLMLSTRPRRTGLSLRLNASPKIYMMSRFLVFLPRCRVRTTTAHLFSTAFLTPSIPHNEH